MADYLSNMEKNLRGLKNMTGAEYVKAAKKTLRAVDDKYVDPPINAIIEEYENILAFAHNPLWLAGRIFDKDARAARYRKNQEAMRGYQLKMGY